MLNFPKLMGYERDKNFITQFSGLDQRKGADSSHLIFEKNMSPSSLPVLSTRAGRKKIYTVDHEGESIIDMYFLDHAYIITSCYGETRLYYGDDFTSLRRCFVSGTNENNASPIMTLYNGKICLFNLKDSETGTSLVTAPLEAIDKPSRIDAPEFTDITVYEGRVIGCRRKQIRACAYDDISDWDDEAVREDTSVNAYLKNFAVNTEFTACTNYKNRVIFFTEDEMFELSGKNHDNFDIVKIADAGCLNRHSLCQIDGKLYFLSREGVMCYTGTSPARISKEICDVPIKTENGFSSKIGGCFGKLYVSFEGESGRNMYVYDIENQKWGQEDSISPLAIVGKHGKTCFATEFDIYQTDCSYTSDDSQNDGLNFEWEAVTQTIWDYTPKLKRASSLEIYLDQRGNSRVEVYISFDGADFELMHSEMLSGAREISIPLSNRHYQKLKVKIKGRGEASIHYIGQSYIQGGRIR